MTRQGGQLPWGSGGPVYRERRDTQRRNAFLGGAAVLAFLFAVFFVFRACTGSSCAETYCPTSANIPPPEGYERLTSVFKVREGTTVPDDKQIQVQLRLDKTTADGRNLSFYRYVAATKAWEPLTPAVLDAEGKTVSALLTAAPDQVAVLRRLSAAGHVVAYLAHNAPLHPEAVGEVTIVHTRDFRPSSDGSIAGELTAFQITGAKTDGSVAFLPSLYGDATDKTFLPIVTGILANSAARSNHVQQIVRKVVETQLAGIDIDYRDLPAEPATRTSFSLFIAELGQALKAQNKQLTVTLPAPIRTQERIDEGAYDWAEIGRSADIVQMRVLRDQSTYRQAMPAILTHLTAAVPANKIVFTVSPYSTEKSPSDVSPLALTQAMTIATKMAVQGDQLTTNTNVNIVADNIARTSGRSGIVWEPQTATVAFTYEQNGGRTIWIENFFSVGFKLEFISRFKLGGLAIEDGSADPSIANLWPALSPFIATGQPILLQPNSLDLSPTWKASKGVGEVREKGGAFTWQTPAEPGTYTITLTVSDGVSRFENELPVTVQQKDRATPTPTTGAR